MTRMTVVVAESDYAVTLESSFKELNSRGFVRGATSLDQCYLLVNEGWEKTRFPKNEMVRDYLVTMLHRYLTHTRLFEQVSAFNYLAYFFGKQEIDSPCVNEVADMCLQCAAFFPNMSEYRHEMKSHQYIIEVGTSLYGQLARASTGKDDWYSRAFQHMSEFFIQAMLILRSTCPRLVQKAEVYTGVKRGATPFLTNAETEKISKTVYELERLFLESHTVTTSRQIQ